MQSLSVSNLQVFDMEDNGYLSGSDYQLNKSFDAKSQKKKLKLKLSLPKFMVKTKKYDINSNDSGYISGTTSAETIFSVDSNNYVSFKVNPQLDRHSINSIQSLYDKSPVDLSEVFGLNFKSISVPKQINSNLKNKIKSTSSVPLLPSITTIKQRPLSLQNQQPAVKYENRSWDQILKLSDSALNQWVSASGSTNNGLNYAFNRGKACEFFEPNIEVKNSLLLNQNLLYQPIRRYASEVNLRKLVSNSTELFSDDFQMESHFASDQTPREIFFGDRRHEEAEELNRYTDEIYDLFMDLHEFRVNDENIDKVAEKISKIDKYLMLRIKSNDLAGYLLVKSMCGCSMSSLCSIIQFSQALTKIVVDCIDCKIACYQRIAYIIAFIKVINF